MSSGILDHTCLVDRDGHCSLIFAVKWREIGLAGKDQYDRFKGYLQNENTNLAHI